MDPQTHWEKIYAEKGLRGTGPMKFDERSPRV